MNSLLLVSSLALATAGCSVLFDNGVSADGGASQVPDAAIVKALELTEAGTYSLDTTTGILTGPDEVEVYLEHSLVPEVGFDGSSFQVRRVAVDSLTIASVSQLRASGVHALAFDVAGDVVIKGDVDVSSYLDEETPSGPGSGYMDCHDLDASPGSATGAAGGAGASFESNGGHGGAGYQTTSTDSGTLFEWQGALRGGCGGGDGAVRSGGDEASRARGGNGGGALRIVSTTSIVLTSSTIRASGAGGQGGKAGLHGSGGGGGSGGTLWLEAPMITLQNSTLRSNGGGGGEGASACVRGEDGVDGATPSIGTAAAGGDTPNGTVTCGGMTYPLDEAGGDGGAGSRGDFGNPKDGFPAQGIDVGINAGGGGGGGGSEGFIIIETAGLSTQNSDFEPPARMADGSERAN